MSDRAPSPSPADVSMPQQEPTTLDAEIQVQEVESIALPSPTASVGAKEDNASSPLPSRTGSVKTEGSCVSTSPPLVRKKKAERERRTALMNDPQAEMVEPWRILCRCCKKWIKLATQSTYASGNWSCHKLRCGEYSMSIQGTRRAPPKPTIEPSSRVATAERRSVLLNDPQVKECSPRHILCGTCRTVVILNGELDYNLASWSAHKEKCIPKTPAPITTHERASRRAHVPFPTPSTSSTDSHVSVGGSRRSPPTPTGSNAQLKEATKSTPAATVKAGVKRGREEEVEAEAEEEAETDARPRNRPRKETYEPPEENASDVFGLFLLPFQNLTRGFREGVGFT